MSALNLYADNNHYFSLEKASIYSALPSKFSRYHQLLVGSINFNVFWRQHSFGKTIYFTYA